MLENVNDLKSLLNDPGLLETRAYTAGEWTEGTGGRIFHRMVRRRGESGLWRNKPGSPVRRVDHGFAPADRYMRRDNAVEFPQCDDHSQGCNGVGVFDFGASCESNAAVGIGVERFGRTRGAAEGCAVHCAVVGCVGHRQ